jgi:peptidoglycan-N-acetylglucosamine deacetylase
VSASRYLLFGMLASAYGLLVSSLWLGPPPTWVSGLLLLGLVTVVTLGSIFLNLALFVPVVARGDARAPNVALTFDDGPHPVHTRRVMDLLEAGNARGTFFLIGEKAAQFPDLVCEMVRRGHEIALHSYSHDRLLNMRHESRIVKDLERTQQVIERAVEVRPILFRPPVGLTSPRTQIAVARLGLRVVGWTARAFDGAARPDAATVLRRIEPNLKPGAIVLLHDAAERGDEPPTSLEALPQLLDAVARRGLSCLTVSQLVGVAKP